jgi:hypothetical protein
MRQAIRQRITAALVLFGALTLCLGASGCTWLLWDAPKLWQTELGAGLHNRGQDVNFMQGNSSEASLGGW